VLRNSVCYSALLRKNIRIFNIRANRKPKTGLMAQHLTGIQLIRTIFGGEMSGDKVGSAEITYKPGDGQWDQKDQKHSPLTWQADTGTAGSVMLLMQISLPGLLFLPHPAHVTLKGGTNADKAPLVDYMQEVFLPMFHKLFGGDIKLDIVRRGFYPRGGGIVTVETKSLKGSLKAINLTERGNITKIRCEAVVSGRLPKHIAERMAKSVSDTFAASEFSKVPLEIKTIVADQQSSPSDGCFVMVVCESEKGCRLGCSAIGKRGVSSEAVGKEAADELLKNLREGGCVDEYLQDQLIIYMALAKGRSVIRTGPLTLHTRTAIHFAQEVAGAKFEVKEDKDGQSFLISCEGIGYESRLKC